MRHLNMLCETEKEIDSRKGSIILKIPAAFPTVTRDIQKGKASANAFPVKPERKTPSRRSHLIHGLQETLGELFFRKWLQIIFLQCSFIAKE